MRRSPDSPTQMLITNFSMNNLRMGLASCFSFLALTAAAYKQFKTRETVQKTPCQREMVQKRWFAPVSPVFRRVACPTWYCLAFHQAHTLNNAFTRKMPATDLPQRYLRQNPWPSSEATCSSYQYHLRPSNHLEKSSIRAFCVSCRTISYQYRRGVLKRLGLIRRARLSSRLEKKCRENRAEREGFSTSCFSIHAPIFPPITHATDITIDCLWNQAIQNPL